MKKSKRALRRFHQKRIQKKREKYFPYRPTESLNVLIETPVTCSCWMCGNPRKYFNEKTKQELIAKDQWELALTSL